MILGWSRKRHVIAAAAVLSAICVAYFYLLDRGPFSSAHFSNIFRLLLTRYDVHAAWLAFAICLSAVFWSRPAPILGLADTISRYPTAFAVIVSAALAVGAVAIYHNYPLSMDEYSAVFQAQTFASGSVASHVQPALIDWLVVRGFNGSFLITSQATGEVVSAYWPGFALLLAPFEFLKIPWVCNPLLSGLTAFLVYRIASELAGNRLAGGWAMLFAVASGAFLAEGLSYYSMQAHLAANLMFVALLMKPTAYRTFGAGLIGSLALVLHNPVPHALFAIPWIAATVFQPERRRYLLPLLAGYLPGLLTGFAWLMFRNNIGASDAGPATLAHVTSGVFAWPGWGAMNNRVAALVKMCVWAMPGLFVLALVGFAVRRVDSRARLMAYSAALTFGAYIFVTFDQGHGWGYRYFHSAWGVVPIFAGCAMVHKPASNGRMVAFGGAVAILSLVLLIPLQMSQIEGFISQHLAQIEPPKRPGNNVYFVHPLGGSYVADMVQFDPLLRTRDLLLVSHGRILDEQLIRANWPAAVRMVSNQIVEQWYLGPKDQRYAIAGKYAERQFVIPNIPSWSSIPSLPSAAGH